MLCSYYHKSSLNCMMSSELASQLNLMLSSTMFWTRGKPHLVLGTHGPLKLLKCRLPLASFDTHMYVVGKTKKGKSKFLEHVAYQLITLGQGCGLLDPHSDLADDLLAYLSSDLMDDSLRQRVIYFDPSRTDYLIPFNVLNAPYSAYETAQNVVEAFRRTWPDSLREAPRFANIALAALITLIENKLTLVEMHRLLTDSSYREGLLTRVSNPEVVSFFRDRYDRWGREQPLMTESLLNKTSALVLNPRLRLILGQRENGLNFREIMDEGKVLIIDLGRCDGETRRLLGSLIVTGLEQAALSRKGTKERPPFYLFIDEFQDYCANEGSIQTLAKILSECRKFGLHMTLAHQTLSQIGDERLQGALENAQIKVIFGTGRQTAEVIAKELFIPELEEVKHEVEEESQKSRTHPTFYPLFEQWEKLIQLTQSLPRRSILVQLPERQKVVRLNTVTVHDGGSSPNELERLKRTLTQRVGKACCEMEGEIANNLRQDSGEPGFTYWEARTA